MTNKTKLQVLIKNLKSFSNSYVCAGFKNVWTIWIYSWTPQQYATIFWWSF